MQVSSSSSFKATYDLPKDAYAVCRFQWPKKKKPSDDPRLEHLKQVMIQFPFAVGYAKELVAHIDSLPASRGVKVAKEVEALFKKNDLVQEALGCLYAKGGKNIGKDLEHAKHCLLQAVELNSGEAELFIQLRDILVQLNDKEGEDQVRVTISLLTQPNRILPPLSQQFLKSLTSHRELLKEAVDGTEPLSDVIDKVYGGDRKKIAQELVDELIMQYDNAKEMEKNEWKLRLEHLLGQYLMIASGLILFSKKERRALQAAEKPVDTLIARLSYMPRTTVRNLCRVLGATKKQLVLALIMQTQKPGADGWPDMLNLLLQTQSWEQPKQENRALDRLASKLFGY